MIYKKHCTFRNVAKWCPYFVVFCKLTGYHRWPRPFLTSLRCFQTGVQLESYVQLGIEAPSALITIDIPYQLYKMLHPVSNCPHPANGGLHGYLAEVVPMTDIAKFHRKTEVGSRGLFKLGTSQLPKISQHCSFLRESQWLWSTPLVRNHL